MQFLNEIDHQFFLTLNTYHAQWLDQVMLIITHKYTWIPLYAFLIALIIYKFKKQSWIIILAVVVLIAISDRFTSGLMKPYFARMRPCHDIALAGKMILVGDCGGEFGMASSHAANTFAATVFLILLFRREYQLVWLLLPWSLLVSYSRIYLGVHFPGDILMGYIVGFCSAMLIFYLLPIKLLNHRASLKS